MGEVAVRGYQEADAAATLGIFRRAVRETAARDYSPEQVGAWAPDDIDLERWARKRAATTTVVAVIDEEVVGFTDLSVTGYLDMLFVAPDHGGRGVASALLDWVDRTAAERGLVEITVHASLTARPVFEHRGFVVEREQHPVLDGVELTNFAMRKRL